MAHAPPPPPLFLPLRPPAQAPAVLLLPPLVALGCSLRWCEYIIDRGTADAAETPALPPPAAGNGGRGGFGGGKGGTGTNAALALGPPLRRIGVVASFETEAERDPTGDEADEEEEDEDDDAKGSFTKIVFCATRPASTIASWCLRELRALAAEAVDIFEAFRSKVPPPLPLAALLLLRLVLAYGEGGAYPPPPPLLLFAGAAALLVLLGE